MVFHTLNGDFEAPPFHVHCRSIIRPWQSGYLSKARAEANAELQNRPMAERRIGPNGPGGTLPPPVDGNPPKGGAPGPSPFEVDRAARIAEKRARLQGLIDEQSANDPEAMARVAHKEWKDALNEMKRAEQDVARARLAGGDMKAAEARLREAQQAMYPKAKTYLALEKQIGRKDLRAVLDSEYVPTPPKPFPFKAPEPRKYALPKSAVRDKQEIVYEEMSRLHWMPEKLSVKVESLKRIDAEGAYSPITGIVAIDPKARFPLNIVAHETAHRLDHLNFVEVMASRKLPTESWRRWFDAVKSTARYEELTKDASEWGEYMLLPEELWARSYAQWLAVRSGRREILDELNAMRKSGIEDYLYAWDDDDFGDVLTAIDELVKEIG